MHHKNITTKIEDDWESGGHANRSGMLNVQSLYIVPVLPVFSILDMAVLSSKPVKVKAPSL